MDLPHWPVGNAWLSSNQTLCNDWLWTWPRGEWVDDTRYPKIVRPWRQCYKSDTWIWPNCIPKWLFLPEFVVVTYSPSMCSRPFWLMQFDFFLNMHQSFFKQMSEVLINCHFLTDLLFFGSCSIHQLHFRQGPCWLTNCRDRPIDPNVGPMATLALRPSFWSPSDTQRSWEDLKELK